MQSRDARIAFRGLARVVAPGTSLTGEVLNLSAGGALLRVAEPLAAGRRITVTIELGDAKPPIAVHAVVVRSLPQPHPAQPGAHELGVRFVRIPDEAVRRINQLVAGYVPAREPFLGPVRVRIPGLPVKIRASARERSPGTLLLESELTWVRLGAPLSVEVAPGDVRAGKLAWLGVELTPSGHARLVFTVDVHGQAADLDEPPVAVIEPGTDPGGGVVAASPIAIVDDSPAIEEDLAAGDLPAVPPLHGAPTAPARGGRKNATNRGWI